MIKVFDYDIDESIGSVNSVDRNNIVIRVIKEDSLIKCKIGNIIALAGSSPDVWNIGLITSANRTAMGNNANIITAIVVGTYDDNDNRYTKSIYDYPLVDKLVYPVIGDMLTKFLNHVLHIKDLNSGLMLGKYFIDNNAESYACLDGNKFFQRHAAIFGSTGSGKSWTVASILEKINDLNSPNVIVLDIHGEYGNLDYCKQYSVSMENKADEHVNIPYWMLNADEVQSILIGNSEFGSQNQTSVVFGKIKELKSLLLKDATINDVIPYSMEDLIDYIKKLDTEMVLNKATGKSKQGNYFGKLSRLVYRMEHRVLDPRYSFMFSNKSANTTYKKIREQLNATGIKIINLSGVPIEILPVVLSILVRIIFDIKRDEKSNNITRPSLVVCDEAHLYMPSNTESLNVMEKQSLFSFARIAREGRKYGLNLLVVSQRPSDINTGILAQCNNVMALRLMNERDINAVRSLLPETSSTIVSELSNLDIGQCIIAGDATLLPLKIVLDTPKLPPLSQTIDIWSEWDKE